MNRNERMEKLQAKGVNVSKYFNVELPNGLKPGATISLVINENGQPVIVGGNAQDSLREQIIEDGYVRNTKLHRRFVMAQMFHMLNYVSHDKRDFGYNAYLRRMYSYQYTLDMMLEEVRVLSKLETRDKESFAERSHFFTQDVVVAVLDDYLAKLRKYVDGLPEHKCKGVPCKRVKGRDIFVSDLEKKLYCPIYLNIERIANANSYEAMYRLLEKFMRNIVKLPYDTPKSKVWIDAYKGAGAYYTLKNLVMFHNCGVDVGGYYHTKIYGVEAMEYLKSYLDIYQGEYYRMFALMKKVIDDNNFDFTARMYEIGAYE